MKKFECVTLDERKEAKTVIGAKIYRALNNLIADVQKTSGADLLGSEIGDIREKSALLAKDIKNRIAYPKK